MSDEWMPTVQLNLSRGDFDRLPRHPAFKYELINGVTWISPWPRHAHAQLRLARYRPQAKDVAKLPLRTPRPEDREALAPLFEGAFARLQPFGSLDDDTLQEAARKSLSRTFEGGDGPLAFPASFVAEDEHGLAGAILITLLPGGDPWDWDATHWRKPPPKDLWARGKGQPHLTWIFVRCFEQGIGVGTQLLRQAVRVLGRQGYKTLLTTFLIGNDSSMLWHWRNGFELLPGMFSKRRMRRELR